jgi:hypothetical protein
MRAAKPLLRQLLTHPSEEVRTLRIPYGTSALPGARIRAMARLAAASFDAEPLSSHNLKREAINTAKDCRVHPSQLKQLGQHATYASFGGYLEVGDLFVRHALHGAYNPIHKGACDDQVPDRSRASQITVPPFPCPAAARPNASCGHADSGDALHP